MVSCFFAQVIYQPQQSEFWKQTISVYNNVLQRFIFTTKLLQAVTLLQNLKISVMGNKMNNKTSINYLDSLKSLLPPEKFKRIKNKIAKDSCERLEAFWSIIVAGYPVDFALSNYKQLYAYLLDKPIDYTEALTTYSVYPELKNGIYIKKTYWFELN